MTLNKAMHFAVCFDVLVCMVILAACGREADYKSKAGARYYLQGARWKPEDIEAQEKHLLAGLVDGLGFDRVRAASGMERLSVYVMPDRFACSASASGYCNGEELEAMLMVRDMGCPFNSALSHETAHWLLQWSTGSADGSHSMGPLWSLADSAAGVCP